jgi:hypothetical protein
MASMIPSKLGSRASAVTASPARRAAAVVDGPIVDTYGRVDVNCARSP